MTRTLKQGQPWGDLTVYLLFSYLLNVYFSTAFLANVELVDLRSMVFVTAVAITYPLVYLFPVILLYQGVKIYRRQWLDAWPVRAIIVVLSTCITLLLYGDSRLYELFAFHINAFAINILTTPGGLESLGGSPETFITFAAIALLICLTHLVGYWLSGKIDQRVSVFLGNHKTLIIGLVIFLGLGERIIYGVSDIQLHGTVLQSSSAFPLYQRVTFGSLAAKAGFEVNRRKGIRLGVSNLDLNYPLAPIAVEKPARPLNLIWLVAESWRWDMLNEEIMPGTWQFAQSALNFEHHYSGGNGTRQGLFALFYGIYGNYWDAFLVEEKGPVFLDALKRQQYQMSMYTSASFTYPEFDKTIFAQVPSSQLHQFDNGMSVVEKDAENVTRLLRYLDQRQPDSPFFTFMFFESTHARYYFPEAQAIRSPYLGDLNYATVSKSSLKKDIDQLKNRYINASHYLDSQFSRIFQYLEDHNLLENTIVLVCGDHGEEFMEKGHWGHNAGFSEEQVRTPMILYVPGTAADRKTFMSSHMDIIPTLLPLLGVKNSTSDYSLGQDLLGESKKNPYAVISDWAGLAYVDAGNKFTMPFKSTFSGNNLSTRDDQPVESSEEFLKLRHEELMQVLGNSRKFLKQ